MSFRIKQDMLCNRLTSVKREAACWELQVSLQGGNEIAPEAISQALIERLAKNLVALAESAKSPKGQKADGLQLLGEIRSIDKDLTRLTGSLTRAQARLAELPQVRADAIRDSTDDGTLLARLDGLAGEKARIEQTCQQVQVEIQGLRQAKAGLLNRFRVDRDASLQTAFAAERKAVHAALAEAWTEFEKVVSPTLQKVVEAQAKLLAIEAQTTFPAVQARLEEQLLASATIPVPTASAKQPELAAAS